MKLIFAILCGLVFSHEVLSEQKNLPKLSKNAAELIELEKSSGDLNGDGKADDAVVLTECGYCISWEKETPPKMMLRISLSGEKPVRIESTKANCYQCGGAKGSAVLGTPDIKKGILLMYYQGGSRFSWSSTFKWRWNKSTSEFDLIGWS